MTSAVGAMDPRQCGCCGLHELLSTNALISLLQPCASSDRSRLTVKRYLDALIKQIGADREIATFAYGSVPLRTYLPDGDLDMGVCVKPGLVPTFFEKLQTVLQQEGATSGRIRQVLFINAEIKLVKCFVGKLLVDISVNTQEALATACFFEEIDRTIGRQHLFKRGLLLIKAWCMYESRILGSNNSLLSTYALETLVLYICNLYHSTISTPLCMLHRFLVHFANFNFDHYCVTVQGRVLLRTLVEEGRVKIEHEEGGGPRLLSEESMARLCHRYTTEGFGRVRFLRKHLNVMDPLDSKNNLGRSVSLANSQRIKLAFAKGASVLGQMLDTARKWKAKQGDALLNELIVVVNDTEVKDVSADKRSERSSVSEPSDRSSPSSERSSSSEPDSPPTLQTVFHQSDFPSPQEAGMRALPHTPTNQDKDGNQRPVWAALVGRKTPKNTPPGKAPPRSEEQEQSSQQAQQSCAEQSVDPTVEQEKRERARGRHVLQSAFDAFFANTWKRHGRTTTRSDTEFADSPLAPAPLPSPESSTPSTASSSTADMLTPPSTPRPRTPPPDDDDDDGDPLLGDLPDIQRELEVMRSHWKQLLERRHVLDLGSIRSPDFSGSVGEDMHSSRPVSPGSSPHPSRQSSHPPPPHLQLTPQHPRPSRSMSPRSISPLILPLPPPTTPPLPPLGPSHNSNPSLSLLSLHESSPSIQPLRPPLPHHGVSMFNSHLPESHRVMLQHGVVLYPSSQSVLQSSISPSVLQTWSSPTRQHNINGVNGTDSTDSPGTLRRSFHAESESMEASPVRTDSSTQWRRPPHASDNKGGWKSHSGGYTAKSWGAKRSGKTTSNHASRLNELVQGGDSDFPALRSP